MLKIHFKYNVKDTLYIYIMLYIYIYIYIIIKIYSRQYYYDNPIDYYLDDNSQVNKECIRH